MVLQFIGIASSKMYKVNCRLLFCFKGEIYSNQNWACFVHYLKIFSTFFETWYDYLEVHCLRNSKNGIKISISQMELPKFPKLIIHIPKELDTHLADQSNILHVLINNTRTSEANKLLMPFFEFLRHLASKYLPLLVWEAVFPYMSHILLLKKKKKSNFHELKRCLS